MIFLGNKKVNEVFIGDKRVTAIYKGKDLIFAPYTFTYNADKTEILEVTSANPEMVTSIIIPSSVKTIGNRVDFSRFTNLKNIHYNGSDASLDSWVQIDNLKGLMLHGASAGSLKNLHINDHLITSVKFTNLFNKEAIDFATSSTLEGKFYDMRYYGWFKCKPSTKYTIYCNTGDFYIENANVGTSNQIRCINVNYGTEKSFIEKSKILTFATLGNQTGFSIYINEHDKDLAKPPSEMTKKDWDRYKIMVLEGEYNENNIPNYIDAVNKIPAAAFYGCYQIQSVKTQSVTTIEEDAFRYCSALTYVDIPAVKTIKSGAFYQCSALQSIVLPDSLTELQAIAFNYCSKLSKVTMPMINVGSEGMKDVFYGSDSLMDFTFTKVNTVVRYTALSALKWIPDNYFSEFFNLRSVEIIEKIYSIGMSAFENCVSLVGCYYDGSVAHIGNDAFSGCTSLKTNTKDDSIFNMPLTEIGERAFYNCGQLRKVRFDLTENYELSIGADAFNCQELFNKIDTTKEDVSVPLIGAAKITFVKMSDDAAENERLIIKAWCEKVSFANMFSNPLCYAHQLTINENPYLKLTIPDDVSRIGQYAFYHSNFTEMNLKNANSLTNIGSFAFLDCNKFSTLALPNTNLTIEEYAFKNCTNVTELTFGSGNKNIHKNAFDNLTSLQTLDYSAVGVGSEIAEAAFSNCSSLQKVLTSFTGASHSATGERGKFYYVFGGSLPETLKTVALTAQYTKKITVAPYGFRGIKSIDTLELKDTYNSDYNGNINFGNTAFENCSLKRIDIKDLSFWANQINFTSEYSNPIAGDTENYLYLNDERVNSLDLSGLQNKVVNNYAFCDGRQIKSVNLSGISVVGIYAFYKCSLASITIPDSVTSIGYSAFEYCSLTSATISDNSVTSIGNHAFGWCGLLTSVTIGNSVTSIGSYAFERCVSLTSVIVGNSVRSIGDLAFYYCTSLTSVTIPDSVTKIGYEAFGYCEKLSSAVVLPAKLQLIGAGAFYKCPFSEITIPFTGNEPNSTGEKAALGWIFANKVSGKSSEEINSQIPTTLNTVSFNKDISTIVSYSFYNCKTLTKITLPSSAKTIEDHAFSGCNGAAFFTTQSGEGVTFTNVGTEAFLSCQRLKFVTVSGAKPNSFYNCKGLISVITKDSLSQNAFNNCTIESVNTENTLTTMAFNTCTIKSVTPKGSLAYRAFYNCPIETLYLWDVVSNKQGAFNSCFVTNISIKVYSNVTTTQEHENIGYVFGGGTAILNTTNVPTDLKKVTIGGATGEDYWPGSWDELDETNYSPMNVIPNQFLAGCQGLEEVVISSLIVRIGSDGEGGNFCANCPALNSIIFDKSDWLYNDIDPFYQSESERDKSLYQLYKLNSNNIGRSKLSQKRLIFVPSVTSGQFIVSQNVEITEGAFDSCDKITTLNISDNVKINDSSLLGLKGLKSLSMYPGVYSNNVLQNMFGGSTNIPSTLKSVEIKGSGAGRFDLSQGSSLTNVVISKDITSLSKGVLSGCNSIKSLTIPFIGSSLNDTDTNSAFLAHLFGVQYINIDADSGVPQTLKVVTINREDLNKIPKFAFFKCSNIVLITISKNCPIVTIGAYAFEQCKSLKTAPMFDDVTTIGERAFHSCHTIKTCDLYDSLKTIGQLAFADCPSLTTINYEGSKAQWEDIKKGDTWKKGTDNATISYGR